MGAPAPIFLPEAFAAVADPSLRNVIPKTTGDTQRASFNLGFPPKTMTPVDAGGTPMLGPDMNGILYMLSSNSFYAQSGQPYRYSADIVAAIAGYHVGTLLGSADGKTLWYNALADNMNDPDADVVNSGWIGMYCYDIATLAPSVGGTVTLTPTQAARGIVVVTGALVGNLQVIFPPTIQRWLVVNATSAGFTVTAKTAAGSGVGIPQAGFVGPTEVYGDGTNLYNVSSPTTLPTDVAPTPNTIPLRSNTGALFATYLNQSSAQENFTIASVMAEAGDGYLRKITPANFGANFLLSMFGGQAANGQISLASVLQYAAQLWSNANLTGTPTAPTAALGGSGTQIASLSFANPSASIGGANGNFQLANGLIVNYGVAAYGSGSNLTNVVATMSRAFPNSVYFAVGIADSGGMLPNWTGRALGSQTFQLLQREAGGGFAAGNFYWLAFGR